MQLWEQRVDPSSIHNPHSYLSTLVRNRIYDVIRHRSVVRAHEERVRYELEVADLEDLSDEEREEMISQAWRLVQSLPEAAREIFLLATMEGLKYSEIAERKGISVNTVKTQLRIARKKLRRDPLAMIGLWLILSHLSSLPLHPFSLLNRLSIGGAPVNAPSTTPFDIHYEGSV